MKKLLILLCFCAVAHAQTTLTVDSSAVKVNGSTVIDWTQPQACTAVHTENGVPTTYDQAAIDLILAMNSLSVTCPPPPPSQALNKSFNLQSRGSAEVESGNFSRSISLYANPEGDQYGARTQVPLAVDMTMRNPGVRITTNGQSGTAVLTLQKNGVDTGVSVSVPPGQTGWISGSGEASFLADDTASWQFVGGGGGSLGWTMTGIEIEPVSETETVSIIGINSSNSSDFRDPGRVFFRAAGTRKSRTDELQSELEMPIGGTLSHFAVATGNISRTTCATVGTRIANADGFHSACLVEGVEHGRVDDTTTDTITAGDRFSYYHENPNNEGACNLEKVGINLINTAGEFVSFNASHYRDSAYASTTRFYAAGGSISSSTTESDMEYVVPFDLEVTQVVTRAVNAGDAVVTLRKNGADTGLSLSFSDSGYYGATGTVSFNAGDTMALKVDFGTSTRLGYVGIVANSVVP